MFPRICAAEAHHRSKCNDAKVFCFFSALACLLTSPAFAAPAYTVTNTITLPGETRWDYVTFDDRTHHVLVAHSDHTDIIDGITGKPLGTLQGLHGAHGQTVAATGDIYADSGKTADVTLFDATTLKPIATLPAGVDADAVIYEPHNKLVAVLNGDAQTATLIDSTTRSSRSTIKLGGEPEFATADGLGTIYVNLASTAQIAKIDAGQATVTATFPVPGCVSPHGLTMDPSAHRLFTTCANAVLMTVDSDTGKILQTLPIGHGTDAAAYDPIRRRVFSSNADGTISVFTERADGQLDPAGAILTTPGARTMSINPQTGRLFLVAADIDTAQPVTEGPYGKRYAWKPGSVKLLFLDPAAGAAKP